MKIPHSLSRRQLLGGVGGILGGPLLATVPSFAIAEDRPPIGTYPSGVSQDSITIGVTLPFTGAYSLEAEDQLAGVRLAVEHLNAGKGALRQMSPAIKQGLLGKQVRMERGDTELKANNALQIASSFIRKSKVMMLYGSVSSATAIAMTQFADKEKVLYMAGTGGANEITGSACKRYGFRTFPTIYPIIRAMIPFLAKEIGGDRKIAYSVPDYAWGHSTFESIQDFAPNIGWKTVSKQVHPLGLKDFSSYLINIASSGADTLIITDYGADAVNIIKQAKQYGILEKMTLVVPWCSSFLGKELGPGLVEGLYTASSYWWALEKQIEIAKVFNSEFFSREKRMPSDSAFTAYTALAFWADAVERAQTFYPPAVIKALEQEVVLQTPVGPMYIRAEDHQGICNFPLLRGKAAEKMRNPDDFFDIVSVFDGKRFADPLEQFPCKLGPYV